MRKGFFRVLSHAKATRLHQKQRPRAWKGGAAARVASTGMTTPSLLTIAGYTSQPGGRVTSRSKDAMLGHDVKPASKPRPTEAILRNICSRSTSTQRWVLALTSYTANFDAVAAIG
jgi:hypothetical protein